MFLGLLCPGGVFAENTPLINEVLPHPSSGNKEWIEIYNPDKIDLSKYFIDDDLDFNSDVGSSAKKSLAVLIATDSAYPYIELSSFLNDSGDYAVLFSSDGKVVDQYQYAKDPGTDISLGRFPDGADYWDILSSTTKGAQNSQPIPTPTPTPMPTSTPTPTNTPTPKPTPTSIPTPTPKVTLTPFPKLTPLAAKNTGATNEAILGERTSNSLFQIPTSQSEKIAAFSAKDNTIISKILIFIGIVFLIACVSVFSYPYIVKFISKRNE